MEARGGGEELDYPHWNLGQRFTLLTPLSQVLTAGAMLVTPDPRYSLVGGYNLRMKNINKRNGGEYSCTISTLGLPVSVRHILEILGEFI